MSSTFSLSPSKYHETPSPHRFELLLGKISHNFFVDFYAIKYLVVILEFLNGTKSIDNIDALCVLRNLKHESSDFSNIFKDKGT